MKLLIVEAIVIHFVYLYLCVCVFAEEDVWDESVDCLLRPNHDPLCVSDRQSKASIVDLAKTQPICSFVLCSSSEQHNVDCKKQQQGLQVTKNIDFVVVIFAIFNLWLSCIYCLLNPVHAISPCLKIHDQGKCARFCDVQCTLSLIVNLQAGRLLKLHAPDWVCEVQWRSFRDQVLSFKALHFSLTRKAHFHERKKDLKMNIEKLQCTAKTLDL